MRNQKRQPLQVQIITTVSVATTRVSSPPPPFSSLLPDVELQHSWILNAQDAVVFSRRFLVVKKRWRVTYELKEESTATVKLRLPTDLELASAITERNNRDGFGIHIN